MIGFHTEVRLSTLCTLQGDSKRGVEAGGGSSVGHEDSDLERKRREAEALLQSVGITPDIPHGKHTDTHSLHASIFPLTPTYVPSFSGCVLDGTAVFKKKSLLTLCPGLMSSTVPSSPLSSHNI